MKEEPKVDPKAFPLLGMGDYLAKVGNLEVAKHSYRTTLTSPKATEDHKKEAIEKMAEVDKRMRQIAKKLVDFHVNMIPTKDLKLSDNIVEMPMSSDDYKRMKEDIGERGIQIPLSLDKGGKVICGKNRLKAAVELKIEYVPCFTIGIEKKEDIEKYSLADNLNRRQLNREERIGWVADMLRRRREVVQGRPKGGPRVSGDARSNREIAEVAGVPHQIVDRMEDLTDTRVSVSKAGKPQRIWVSDKDKWLISKGKDFRRDSNFSKEVSTKVKDRIDGYFNDLPKGRKMTVEVTYQVEEDE
jgi:hypothetical protein